MEEIFVIEVDVCIARPPTPANTRTATVTLTADTLMEAELTAIEVATVTRPNIVMAIGHRVIEVRI
jgi:hypothetical protein